MLVQEDEKVAEKFALQMLPQQISAYIRKKRTQQSRMSMANGCSSIYSFNERTTPS
jgi:hypothetical protein